MLKPRTEENEGESGEQHFSISSMEMFVANDNQTGQTYDDKQYAMTWLAERRDGTCGPR